SGCDRRRDRWSHSAESSLCSADKVALFPASSRSACSRCAVALHSEPWRRRCGFIPAECNVASHAGPAGNGERTGLEISIQNATCEQLDARRAVDVSFQITADGDCAGPDRSGDLGAGLDGQIAIDIHITLEAASHANVAGSLDLAVDR